MFVGQIAEKMAINVAAKKGNVKIKFVLANVFIDGFLANFVTQTELTTSRQNFIVTLRLTIQCKHISFSAM